MTLYYTKTEDELMKYLDEFSTARNELHLVLSTRNCNLYAKGVTWCGRIVDSKGHQLYQRNVEAKKAIIAPINVAK